MIVTHAETYTGAPACGETMPDSSGLLEVSTNDDNVDCADCMAALGITPVYVDLLVQVPACG